MGIVVPVLGAPRSGTSLVASIVHALGVPMGQSWLAAEPDWQPDHFWADAEFNAIHQQLLGHHDETHRVGDALPFVEHLDAWERLIRQRERDHARWGLKCHLLPLLWPQFAALCRHDVKLLVTARDHQESVLSYATRANVSVESAIPYIARRANAVAAAASSGTCLEISFDRLIDDPTKEVARIAEFIGVPMTKEAIARVKSEWRRFGGAKPVPCDKTAEKNYLGCVHHGADLREPDGKAKTRYVKL